MKVIKVGNEEAPYLTADEREKIAILKLVGTGEFIEGVGIKDGQFYVIAEDEDDQMYLSFLTDKKFHTLTQDVLIRQIRKGHEHAYLKEACEREMGQTKSS